jgi:hypothetical protein
VGLSGGLALAELERLKHLIGVPRSRVTGLADRDDVQGGVELAVAAGIQTVTLVAAAGGVQGCSGV